MNDSSDVNADPRMDEDAMPWYFIYPFFLLHMGGFGGIGFAMAYANKELLLQLLIGGLAILCYVLVYIATFGVDRVRWMFINAALGIFGVYAQIGWILNRFGLDAADYTPLQHAIPFMYYVMYTFLLHQMIIDMTGSRSRPMRQRIVNGLYVGGSVAIYGSIWMAQQ